MTEVVLRAVLGFLAVLTIVLSLYPALARLIDLHLGRQRGSREPRHPASRPQVGFTLLGLSSLIIAFTPTTENFVADIASVAVALALAILGFYLLMRGLVGKQDR